VSCDVRRRRHKEMNDNNDEDAANIVSARTLIVLAV